MIVNKDAPGLGFNDPTSAIPVGGNRGITLGQQRLNVFTDAANIWSSKLAAAAPLTIRIRARFGPLAPCDPFQGVIGAAGPTGFRAGFPNSPRGRAWYPVALASAIAGVDFATGIADPETGEVDGASIDASFNSLVGTPGCLVNSAWYLGLDGGESGSAIDLEAVLLHEFAHGLGFDSLTNVGDSTATPPIPATGSFLLGIPDAFAYFTFDNPARLHWTEMTNAERVASMTNDGNVVFDGPNARAAAISILVLGKDDLGRPKLFMPSSVASGSTASHFDRTLWPNQLMKPFIAHDLTHNVDVPNDLTARALQDLGWPQPDGLGTPGNLTAIGSEHLVALTWSPAPAATWYHVYRSSDGLTYAQLGSDISGTSFSDITATTGKAYLYRVRAFDGTNESPDSGTVLGYAFTFTDPRIGAAATSIKAAHIRELRTAVNVVRTSLTPLSAASFTDATLVAGMSIRREHVLELRRALDAARAALGLQASIYGDATIGAGSPVKKSHIVELRNGL